MAGILIKTFFGLFVWLVLGQIFCKQFKLKKNTKTFVNIACKIVGILMIVYAGADLVKWLLNFK
jgi:TRAP-type C4-dicarboxylate transport system permease large subunit